MHNFYKLIEFVVSVVSNVSTPVKFRQNLPHPEGVRLPRNNPCLFSDKRGLFYTEKHLEKS